MEAFVRAACRGVRQALAGAVREGEWLSAGPLRPGMRSAARPVGIFPVGNAAGEAHPVIAEGISMALQSSWLLAGELGRWRAAGCQPSELPAAAAAYAAAWRRHFAPRLRVAAVIAQWAMRPLLVRLSLPMLRCFPAILTLGEARVSGRGEECGLADLFRRAARKKCVRTGSVSDPVMLVGGIRLIYGRRTRSSRDDFCEGRKPRRRRTKGTLSVGGRTHRIANVVNKGRSPTCRIRRGEPTERQGHLRPKGQTEKRRCWIPWPSTAGQGSAPCSDFTVGTPNRASTKGRISANGWGPRRR